MKTAQIACVLACVLCCRQGVLSERGRVEVQGPTISPDGKSVVFSTVYRKRDGFRATGPVLVLNLRTGLTKEILRPTHTVTWESPEEVPAEIRLPRLEFRAPKAEGWYGFSWSPDGSAVFSTVVVDEGFTIWRLPVRGGKPKMILGFPEALRQRPRVSANGKWVIFYEANSHNLFRIQPNGKEWLPITNTGDAYRLGYAWGPRGEHIYFSRGYMREDGQCGIWRMNADGSAKALILDKYFARNLEVSPSGQYIAFNLIGDDVGYDLFLYRIGEKKPVLLSREAELFFSWHPRWDILLCVHKNVL